MRWAAVTVESPAEGEEPVVTALVDAGCGGAAVEPAAAEGPVDQPGRLRVTGYLPVDDRLERQLSALRARLRALHDGGLPVGDGSLTLRWVEDEDWAHAWKRFFRPLRVGRRFVIRPTWERFDGGPGDRVLAIDPGMAFGTGAHPTTQLCLELMEDRIAPGVSVLDVGTGSGILAIAAAALGAAPIAAIDLDPVAVAAARENVRVNALDARIALAVASAEAVRARYDWVLANLIADAIRQDAGLLAARVAPGGALLAAGIVTERGAEVAAALAAQCLTIEAEATRDGWVAFVARAGTDRDGTL